MDYWSFNSFSLLIADLTVTAEVVLKKTKQNVILKTMAPLMTLKISTNKLFFLTFPQAVAQYGSLKQYPSFRQSLILLINCFPLVSIVKFSSAGVELKKQPHNYHFSVLSRTWSSFTQSLRHDS